MKLTHCLAVVIGVAALTATAAKADPQTHGADYKMRGMTESRSTQSYGNFNYYSGPTAISQAPAVAQQPTERRSFSVEPSVKAPCAPQSIPPAPVAQRQPQATERRAMSVEPAPVQTYNFAPSYPSRSFNRGAPYLRADSKARGY